MAAVSRDRPDDAGDAPPAASGERAAPAAADPVRVRRARIARWSLLANRVGYLLFGLAVALFVVAFVVGFTGRSSPRSSPRWSSARCSSPPRSSSATP